MSEPQEDTLLGSDVFVLVPAARGPGVTFLFQICFKNINLGIKVESTDINVTKSIVFSGKLTV